MRRSNRNFSTPSPRANPGHLDKAEKQLIGWAKTTLHTSFASMRLRAPAVRWFKMVARIIMENMNQNKRKGRCFQVFSLTQFILFFEVAVLSWTGKHLSVSDGLKKYFYQMLDCLPKSSLVEIILRSCKISQESGRILIKIKILIRSCLTVKILKNLSKSCKS